MKTLLAGILLCCIPAVSFSQEQETPYKKQNKNKFYIYWGWNRGWYTDSDIRFHGNNYDFTLYNVKAQDRQSDLELGTYLNPVKMTIPQTNFRVGYFITDHWSISAGTDHMKYVMQQNQEVKISGYIEDTKTEYNNNYNNNDIELREDFLIFEHTDGLNYINTEIRRSDMILDLNKNHFADINFNLVEGLGGGILFPRTNTTLLGNERYDEFHVAGYGFGTMAGLNVTFWNFFFIQSELKGGFINMPDIRTTSSKSDRASQHFFFLQSNIVLGITCHLWKQHNTTKP
ncbi:MAG: hypothetical protein ABI772_03705 [Bacteroidota bacterium]